MHCKPLPRIAVLYPLSYSPAAGCRPIPAAVFFCRLLSIHAVFPSLLLPQTAVLPAVLSLFLSGQRPAIHLIPVFFSLPRYSKRLTNSYLPAALRPPSCPPVHGILRPPCPAHRSPYNRRSDTTICPRCIFFHR